MQRDRIELTEKTVSDLAKFNNFWKHNLTVKQYIAHRWTLKYKIERDLDVNIPDTLHAKLIAQNLPTFYWIIIKNLKYITPDKVEIIASLIEKQHQTTAAELVRIFNIDINHWNWENNRFDLK